jgi:Holliday junction DNA helicase RuvA
MITSVQGILAAVTPLSAVVEINGIGYEVHVPVTTVERLPAVGHNVRLHTLAVYREDAQTLYGFITSEERDFFRLLVEKVTGVGPKLALSILSKLSLSVIKGAIAAGDVALLAKCPGIGKKTAERLVIELRDILPPAGTDGPTPTGTVGPAAARSPIENRSRDAVLALVALGFRTPDADKAVRQAWTAIGPSASTEALVKRALG